MNNFDRPVNGCVQTKITSNKLVSPTVASSKQRGIHTITVTASGDAYIGPKGVSSTTGMKLADGESITIPTAGNGLELYCNGSVILTEWY